MNVFANGVAGHPAVLEHLDTQRQVIELLEKIVRQSESLTPDLVISDADVNGEIDVSFPINGVCRAMIRRTAVSSSWTIGTSSQLVLPANSRRLGVTIVNTGTVGCTITPGETATQYGGIWIASGGGAWDGRISHLLWSGNISAIADSGTTTLSVVEV